MTRKMALYKFSKEGDPHFLCEKKFQYRSYAQERMVADHYSKSLGYFKGEGFIVVRDHEDTVLKKMELLIK